MPLMLPARLSIPLSSAPGLTFRSTPSSGGVMAAHNSNNSSLNGNTIPIVHSIVDRQPRVQPTRDNNVNVSRPAKTIKKKKRATLEPKHLEVLLAAYQRGTRDRDTQEHIKIAEELRAEINAKQVKNWLKNHAAKERKATREALNAVIDDNLVQETTEARPNSFVEEPSSRSGSLYAALFKRKKHESVGLAFFRWEYFDLTVKKRKERDDLDPKNVKDNFLGVKVHQKWSLLSAEEKEGYETRGAALVEQYKSGELTPSKLAISEVYRKAMALIGDARDYCEAANISFLAMSWDQKKDTAELKLHFSDDLSRHTFEELNGMQGRCKLSWLKCRREMDDLKAESERRIALEEARKKLGVLRVEERRAALKARLLILLRDAEPQKNHKKVPWKKLQLGTGNVEIVAPTLSEMKLTKIKNMISRPQSWTDRDCTFLEDNFRSIKVDLVRRREAGRRVEPLSSELIGSDEENDSNPGDGENGSESDKENGSDGGDDCSLGAQGETDNGVGGGEGEVRQEHGTGVAEGAGYNKVTLQGCNGISQVDSGGAGVTDNGVGERDVDAIGQEVSVGSGMEEEGSLSVCFMGRRDVDGGSGVSGVSGGNYGSDDDAMEEESCSESDGVDELEDE
ncbi:hypothetical protein BC829DRAFT_419699 [Chytridium lagenaria]|nr:hypothetical protein BC829DRAFT_419699 [Chytridium lagenaria]